MANFAAGLNCTTRQANRVCVESLDCKIKSLGPSATKESAIEASELESNPTLSLRQRDGVTQIEVLT